MDPHEVAYHGNSFLGGPGSSELISDPEFCICLRLAPVCSDQQQKQGPKWSYPVLQAAEQKTRKGAFLDE